MPTNNFSMNGFLDNASSFGLKYLENKYVDHKDTNTTEKDKEAQKYERIQQKAAPAPVVSHVNNQVLFYGGVGLAALVAVVLVIKK